jgi:PadR family transcriptional regulator, regulatory protein PadR
MPPSDKLDVLQGTLDLLILRTLQWGPQHGHGIGQIIRTRSDDLLQVEHGSLYPALHRLRRAGWIESEWGMTENKQRARFYRLTAKGKKQLAQEETRWKMFVRVMARMARPQE